MYSATVLRSLSLRSLEGQNHTAFRGLPPISKPNFYCLLGLVFGLSPMRFTYVFAVTLSERFGQALTFSCGVLLPAVYSILLHSSLSVVLIYLSNRFLLTAYCSTSDSKLDEHSFHTSAY
uniref:MFS_1_like domain-containing protein n=1 Tax=Ascaris lumbricoides TaxID=6252 RepID=A0A0M3HP39_ASCLU